MGVADRNPQFKTSLNLLGQPPSQTSLACTASLFVATYPLGEAVLYSAALSPRSAGSAIPHVGRARSVVVKTMAEHG